MPIAIKMADLIDEILKYKPNTYDEYKLLIHHQQRELYLEDVDSDASSELVRLIIDFNREDDTLEAEHDKVESNVERKPIYLYINSYGGSVTDAYAIIDAIEMSKTPIYTICVGTAYSAGGIILISGHKRFMYPKASFMFHEGSAGMFGDAGKVKDTMKFYERQLKQLENFILTKTKITQELYDTKLSNDWYLTAEECLQHGIIDKVSTMLY